MKSVGRRFEYICRQAHCPSKKFKKSVRKYVKKQLLNKECGDCCSIDVKEAECYDIAWQEWFESGHEYGLRDKDFLDKGLYDILNFLLIYVRKGK